jgi:mannose-6-phosphate isomerase-like protein (cupin superfamily)
LNRQVGAVNIVRSQMEETMSSVTATKPRAVKSRATKSHTTSSQKVAHACRSEPVLVKGRRDFFTYRDLGVAEASAGALRAQVMASSQGMSRPTGWHYHECDGQFVYILKGWVDLQFEDGRTLRIEEGDSLFIPGYLRHNEIRTSETMEILEVSCPGQMGTTPCDPPEGFAA